MPFNWSKKGNKAEGASDNAAAPAPQAAGAPTPVSSVPPSAQQAPAAKPSPTAPAPAGSASASAAALTPGLKIVADKTFLMQRHGKTVLLPRIALTPLEIDRPPEITDVKVTGVSSSEGLGQWLSAAYKVSSGKAPRMLKQTFTVEPAAVDWPVDQPLSGAKDGANHQLSIAVEHKPIGADGRVSDRKVVLTATINLVPGETMQASSTLIVSPRHLLKTYEAGGGIGPQLTIRLRRETAKSAASQGQEIKLSALNLDMLAAQWGCPGIKSAVEDMLTAVRGTEQSAEGGRLIRSVPRLRLGATERGALNEFLRKSGGALRVPIRIQATGAQPVEMLWELNPQGNLQEGLVVFDLGTSTSVACQFDPNFVDRSVFPREQLAQLQKDFVEFLENPEKEITEESESYWLKLLQGVRTQCGLAGEGDPAKALAARLKFPISSDRGAEDFYEMLRHFELQLWGLDAPLDAEERRKLQRFRERISVMLHQLYSRTFEKMPLGQWNIRLCSPEAEEPFVVSELELIDLAPLPTGMLGRQSADHRIKWLAGEAPEPLGSVREGRFLECPKRFLPHIHQDKDLTELDAWPVTQMVGGKEMPVTLTARQALQASWQCLIDAANGPRRPGVRGIDHVVATYPADLMPEPRGQLEQALRELGMLTVHLEYDESISPAIFHLEQLFGNMEEIGCEAFKIQCEREGNLWSHHMLVLDIGAGTTDISLIRLEMQELLPLHPGEFGGRLYQITPRLLGAAGRSQSGGHQLTLKIFRVLKQLVANWVSEPVSAADIKPDASSAHDFEVCLDAENDDDPQMSAAMDAAERVIPTRFHELYGHLRNVTHTGPADASLADARQRLKRFHVLWKWAEDLKIHLSKILQTSKDDAHRSYPLDDFARSGSWLKETVESLLRDTKHYSHIAEVLNSERHPVPRFKIEVFQQLARDCIERSIKLATAMSTSALENYAKRPEIKEPLSLQSVVLSGRACALPEVQKQLKEQLRLPQLGGGKATIRFRTEYAKSATAIGACRAQRRVASARPHVGAPSQLDGKCEMDIRMENLFFYLPASYRLGTAGNALDKYVFVRHAEFKQHGPAPLGVIRSGSDADTHAEVFRLPSREMLIYRDDGDGNGVLQARLIVQNLVSNITVPNRTLAAECATWRVRFEINHRRQLYALLVRPLFGDSAAADVIDPIFDFGEKSSEPLTVFELDKKLIGPLLAASRGRCPVHIYDKAPAANAQPLVSADEMSRVWCRASASSPATTPAAPAVPAQQKVTAWLGPVMDSTRLVIPRNGRITLYLVNAETNKVIQPVVVEPKPSDPDNPDVALPKFHFSVNFRFAIASDGRFSLVIGDEPRYWETTDVEQWLTSPEGQVLRRELTVPQQESNWWRDPFCGKH